MISYDEIVKRIMHGEKFETIPLKVTFYARVSTDSDKQLNSLDNQLNYYKQYIKNKNNWEYIPGYIDEGITGTRVDKRLGFKKMIKDAKDKKFNLIIAKEVSRFARDLEDSIHYIRKLKEYGVGILFENQNLNTFDTNSELILNIMFNLAQEESKKMSSRIKFGHQQSIKKGHVLGSSNITGYKKNNCKLVIVEEEAKLIRKIFELYSTGKYGLYKLGWQLKELGYLNKSGNIYDKDTLKRIISNPKYKGYYRGHTYEILDYRTKKRKKIEKDEQIIYKDQKENIPAIVSEELWNKANKILNERTKNYQNNNHWSGGLKYPFSNKLYCLEHMNNFSRSYNDKNKEKPIWACSKYLKYRVKACQSPIILEEDLYNIFKDIISNLITNKLKLSNYLINLYKKLAVDNDYNNEIINIDKNIKIYEDKKQLLLDLVFKNELSIESLKEQFKRIDKLINELEKNKKIISEQKKINKTFFEETTKLENIIKEEINEGILKDLIRTLVDKIIVSKIDNNRHNIKLEIYLNLYNKDKEKLWLNNKKINSLSKRKNANNFLYFVYIR